MKKHVALWLISLLFLTISSLDAASTYYVDCAGGNDANSGTAKATPWKHHPYMANWTGSYIHAAGDRFIFKGGVTWTNACFVMQIMAGGTSAGNRDYYGVDQTWYNGATFTRPIFDAQGVELSGGYDVMLLFNLGAEPSHVTLDSLDFRRLYWDGAKGYAQVACVNLSNSHDVTITNCWFHNWTHGSSAGTADSLKIVIGANSSPFNPGCLITGCLIDGENLANSTQGTSSGEGTYAYSGNIVNTSIRNTSSGFIVTGDPLNTTVPQVVSGCDIGPGYVSFDPGMHPDGLFMNGGNLFHWFNNYIHDCHVEALFAGEGSGAENTYIWNNVIYANPTHSTIEIDNFYSGAKIWVYQNTLVGGAFPAVRVVDRGNGPLGVLDFRNNFVVSDAGAVSLDAGASITAYTNQNTVLLTVAQAAARGYTLAGRYAPSSASQPTYNAGQDISTLIGGSLTLDILGSTRPSCARWDAGAYEFLDFFPVASSVVATNNYINRVAVSEGNWRVMMHGDNVLGNVAVFTDPSVTAITRVPVPWGPLLSIDGIECHGTNLAVAYSTGTGMVVKRFALTGAPLPTSATLIETSPVFGNSDSRFIAVLYSASGGLAYVWYQFTAVLTNGTYPLVCGVAYLPPGGATWIQHTTSIAGNSGSLTSCYGFGAAQHPVDGKLWFFVKRDSYDELEGITLEEAGGDVIVTPHPGLLSKAVYDLDSIQGENPSFCAVQGASSIYLAYPCADEHIFSTVPFWKGAFMRIASLDTNGTPTTFVRLNQYTERNQSPSLFVGADGRLSLIWVGVDENGIKSDLHCSTYSCGNWSDQILTHTASWIFFYDRRSPGCGYFDGIFPNTLWHRLTSIGTYVSLNASSYSIQQGNGFVPITAVRSGSLGAMTVAILTQDGTATAGVDYNAISTTLNWADGSSGARTIPVTVLASGASTNRYFTAILTNIPGGVVSVGPISNMIVTIVAPIPPPGFNPGKITFSSTNYSVASTNASVTLTVIRSEGTNTATSCSYATINGTATSGVDYTAVTGTISWATNENSSKTIIVPILDSGSTGTNRVFTVTLSNPKNGATFVLNPATVTIQLPPPVIHPGTLSFSSSGVSVAEVGPNVTITAVRANGSDGTVSVNVATANGTAIAGHDYTATSTILTWADGIFGNQSFTVPIINSGDVATTNRIFTVTMSGATGGSTIAAPSTETVTILMNPPPPPPVIGGVIGFVQTGFTVALTGGSVTIPVARSLSVGTNASVSYATFDGMAKAGIDYTATRGTLTWGIGENSTKTITVPIINSAKQGAPINFTVALSNPTSGATLSAALASVSITLNPIIVPVSGVSVNGQVTVQGSIQIRLK